MYFNLIMIGMFLMVACPVRAMEVEVTDEGFNDLFGNPSDNSDSVEDKMTPLTRRLASYLYNEPDFGEIEVYNYDDNTLNQMNKWMLLTGDEKESVVGMMEEENYVYVDEQGGAKKVRALVVGTSSEHRVKELLGIQEKSQPADPKLNRSKSFWKKKEKEEEVDQEVEVINLLYEPPYSDDSRVYQKRKGKFSYKGTVRTLPELQDQLKQRNFAVVEGCLIVGKKNSLSLKKKFRKYQKANHISNSKKSE